MVSYNKGKNPGNLPHFSKEGHPQGSNVRFDFVRLHGVQYDKKGNPIEKQKKKK